MSSNGRDDRSIFEHHEQVSRRQAAERLVDIAYALAGGDVLELRAGGAGVKVPVAEGVTLELASRSHGDRVEVEVFLSWAAAQIVQKM